MHRSRLLVNLQESEGVADVVGDLIAVRGDVRLLDTRRDYLDRIGFRDQSPPAACAG